MRKVWTTVTVGGFVKRVQGHECSACGHIDAPEQFSDYGRHIDCPDPVDVECYECGERWPKEFTEVRLVVGTDGRHVCHDCCAAIEDAEERAREAENPMTTHDEFRSTERWN